MEKIRAIGKRHKDIKTQILEEFSIKSWVKLSTVEKSKHSLLNCKGCATNKKYHTLINYFPLNKQASTHNKKKEASHNKTQLQTITEHIYREANTKFKKSFPDLEFCDALVMIPKLSLSKRPTYEEKRTDMRKTGQDFKKAIESYKKETAVLRTFGTELSLSKRNKIRMAEYFETPEQCKDRTFKDMEKVDSGKKRKKNHVASHILPWNEEECIEMVRSYPEGYKINFSELARCYGVKNNNSECPKNGGQIVKMFLEENGINFDSFNFKNKSDVHFRRKKRKIAGINISIPTDITNTEVKTNLTKLINDGTYTIGDLIVPQKFINIKGRGHINAKIHHTFPLLTNRG